MSSTESADVPGSDEPDQSAPVAAETARPAGAEPPARADSDLGDAAQKSAAADEGKDNSDGAGHAAEASGAGSGAVGGTAPTDSDEDADAEATERAEQQRLEAMVPVDTEQLERADKAIDVAKSKTDAALDPNRD